MWSRSRIEPARRLLGAVSLVAALAGVLGGCSDIYFDRRETVGLGAEDHLDTNRMSQVIDPWPRDVTRRQIAFDGQKMQSAVERYRTNKVTPPVNVTTSSTAYQQAEQTAAATLNSGNQTLSAPAAPVK